MCMFYSQPQLCVTLGETLKLGFHLYGNSTCLLGLLPHHIDELIPSKHLEQDLA